MRYTAKQQIMDKGWVVWDSVLSRFLGDGKNGLATWETCAEADKAIKVMRQRVGV